MTVHVPKWVLLVGLLALVGAGAYMLGRGSGGSSEGDGSSSGGAAAEAQAAQCDEEAAREAVAETPPEEDLFLRPGEPVLDFFQLELIGCTDLTGDGADEMVVRLLGQTASGLSPWLIYVAEEGGWREELFRGMSTRDSVEMEDQAVRETTGAYAEMEPLCCPSGERSGLVTWDGQTFTYEPDAGIGDGKIRIADAEILAVGSFPVQTGSLNDAIETFREPSTIIRDGEICTASWLDTGLIINFVNLGGANPCGRSGAVGSALVSGNHAEQAGWEIGGTALGVGAGQDQLRDEFPKMQPSPGAVPSEDQQGELGREWTLVSRPSPYTQGETPSLSARLARGTAVAYVMSVGAGGE